MKNELVAGTLSFLISLEIAAIGIAADYKPVFLHFPTDSQKSNTVESGMGTRTAREANDATRDVQFLAELAKLALAMKRKHIDISFELEAVKGLEMLNGDTEVGWTIVAAAVLDAHCDFEKFRLEYSEINRRGGVLDVETFDSTGTKKVLCQGPPDMPPLRLKMLAPIALLKDRSQLEAVRQDFAGFAAFARLEVFHRDHRVYLRVADQDAPHKWCMSANSPATFFRRTMVLRYAHHKWTPVSDSTRELPESEWAPLPTATFNR